LYKKKNIGRKPTIGKEKGTGVLNILYKQHQQRGRGGEKKKKKDAEGSGRLHLTEGKKGGKRNKDSGRPEIVWNKGGARKQERSLTLVDNVSQKTRFGSKISNRIKRQQTDFRKIGREKEKKKKRQRVQGEH